MSNDDDEISSESEGGEDDTVGKEDIDAVLNLHEPEDAFEQYLTWFMGPPPW